MSYVFLFPGQGAQCVGMGKDLYDAHQSVRLLFELCADSTKKNMAELIFNSDEYILQQTENTQIAMTLVSLAVAEVLKEKGIVPQSVAGFSLGEYAAMVVAGVISIGEVFNLVTIRGKIMDEESKRLEAIYAVEGALGMTAIVGMAPETIQAHIDSAKIENVYLSMYNSPIQGVIAGTEQARAALAEILLAEGAKRAILLKVSGAFHTPFMQEASEVFAQQTAHIAFVDPNPSIAIYSNVHGKQVSSGAEMRQLCIEQLTNPVRWIDEQANLQVQSTDYVYETGTGTVLTGLWKAWKKTQNEVLPECAPLGTEEAITEEAITGLEE